MSAPTITGDLTVDTNTLKVDSSNNRVGIGTTSPGQLLHLQTETAKTNSVEHMIQMSHLSSGTTTTGFGAGIRFQGERNNGALQTIGDINFEADVNTGSNISAALVFKPATSGSATERMRIASGGDVTISSGNLVIGTSGKGIDFGVTGNGSGTMTSELFSDYEEGTWTPTTPAGGAGWNSVLSAMYRKVGNIVFLSFYGNLAAQSSTNALKIGGFPYAAAGSNHYAYLYGRVEGYASSDAVWQAGVGTTEATLFFNNSVIGYNNFSANSYVLLSGFYFTS